MSLTDDPPVGAPALYRQLVAWQAQLRAEPAASRPRDIDDEIGNRRLLSAELRPLPPVSDTLLSQLPAGMTVRHDTHSRRWQT